MKKAAVWCHTITLAAFFIVHEGEAQMATTQADVEAAEAARMAFLKGERIDRITSQDGRTIVYAQGGLTLPQFDDAIAGMKAEMNASSGRRRFVLTTTGKGL